MSTRRVTLQDVAAAAAVSITTVSRVINDGPNVRETVRVRVQDAVDSLGYQPNFVARSLRRGRDATIGLVVDSLADIFFATLADSIEQAAVQHGLAVTIASSGRDTERERGLMDRFMQRQVSGIILVPTGIEPDYLRLLRRSTPIVLADRTVDLPGLDAVIGDDRDGAMRATRHLLSHGHRRVAFLGDSSFVQTSQVRLEGYRAAMAEAGVPVDERLVVTGCSDPAQSAAVTGELLAAGDPPTAIFASNVRCSIGAVTALHNQGRTEVAMVGFGDFPLADALNPAVTVLDQDPARMGQLCAERVIDLISGGPHEPGTTVVPVHLIERGSGELPCVQS